MTPGARHARQAHRRLVLDLAETLAAMVRNAFPRLPMRSWGIDESGGDHVLLVVDDQIVFRFPRRGMHGLQLEIAVLRALKDELPVATPSYDYIDPAGRFAGYRYLRGAALTPARFAALSEIRQDEFASCVAQFLARLHRLPPREIRPKGRWPRSWTAAQYSERGATDRLAVLTELFPNGVDIQHFYAAYRCDHPPRLVVVHGDLVPEHILLDEQTEQVSGIIDFGDVALGDPAQDFLGLWAYGEATVRRIVELYAPDPPDPGLLERSRHHCIRYRLDQLYDNRDDTEFDLPACVAQIEALLAGSRMI